jgi:mannosyltransferase OCH1-like enzyme
MTVKMGVHIAASTFGGRLPKQLQRVLLLCVACILLTVFSNAGYIESPLSGRPFHSPRTPHASFLRKIWQTWMVSPLYFKEREVNRVRTWLKMNPGYRYEVLTDANAMSYVEAHFGPDGLNRPDIVYTYRELNVNIIKADFLRYLFMYAEGGVYADIDVEALKPISEFIPLSSDFNEADIDLVIGVEVDEPTFAFHPILGPKCRSFCQWTFMCKPRSPAILRLINNVVLWLNDLSLAQNVLLANITVDFDDIIKGTGPSAFTSAMLAEMTAQTGASVNWDSFHHMTQPKRVGSILVLTIDAFAAGQEHSNSGLHTSEAAMVKHHYHATSWTDSFSRYSHPAYGMVEECSWNMTCVQQWDANREAFPSLPEEQQAKLIAEHEQYWKDVAEREAAEKKAEEEKKAAEEKMAAEKKAAEEKMAAEKKAAEKKAEENKAAEEKKKEENKAADEKKEAEKKVAEEKKEAEGK